MSVKPTDINTLAILKALKASVVLLDIYGYDKYHSVYEVSVSSTEVSTGKIPLYATYAGVEQVYRLTNSILNLNSLYAYIAYRLHCVAGGTARIKLVIGTNTIVLDEIVNPDTDQTLFNAKWVDLSEYLGDVDIYLEYDLAGDGTNNSIVDLLKFILIGRF